MDSLIEKNQQYSSISISMPGNWHDVLSELLKKPGFSKQKIANELGVSVATVRRLQQNNFRIPSAKTIQKLLSLYCLLQTGQQH